MKQGIRVLGIDDAPFQHGDDETFLTGVVYRGTEFIEDIVSTGIEVDADNATSKVLELYKECQNTKQIKAVLIDGISFAGFNIADIYKISEEIEKPVIAITANKPNKEAFRQAMKNSGNYDETFEKFPDYTEIELEDGTVYIQFAGCEEEEAEEIIRRSVLHGLTPEAIRVAHMIGRAFV